MDVSPGSWKDVEFWIVILKLAARLAVLAVVALGGSTAVEDFTSVDLERQEAKAATVDNRVTEANRREDVAYEDFYDLIRYHAERDAGCDTALEMYHGPEDWEKVIEECHSEGRVNGEDSPR